MVRRYIMATLPIPPFWSFIPSTPVIPKLYWNVKSQEQRYKALCECLGKLACYSQEIADMTNTNSEDIKELQTLFEQFMASGFDDYYAEQLNAWIDAHMLDIMKQVLQNGVFFGLTEDGYFTANVMNQLNVIFDTVMDYSDDNYGHLTIQY